MMRTDYFRLRDLKNWLETIPEEDRVMPCFIGGDDTLHYLKIRLVDVDPSKPIIATKSRHIYTEGEEQLLISNGKFDENEVTGIGQYIDCWNSKEFTSVSDILEKIESLGPGALDLPMFIYDDDMKTYVSKGIGLADTTDEETAMDICSCLEGNAVSFPSNTSKNPDAFDRAQASFCKMVKAWKQAFVIETTDGVSLQDFRFYNAWDENKD